MKTLRKVLLCLLVLVAALAIAVYCVFGNEISTAASMKLLRERDDSHRDGAVYTMHVKGGFYLDDFVSQGGVKSDSELIAFITSHITKGLMKMEIQESDIGCSSFTATTTDGDRLFARNYDFAKTNTCLVFTEKNAGRHASISTVDLQFLGMDVEKNVEGLMNRISCLAAPYAPLDGVNDAGVACGIYMTYQGGETTIPTNQDTGKPDFTSTTLLRLILDYADNVDEAVEIARTYDLHDSANTSYHYMVADASGRSAILEWVTGTDTTDNDGGARELVVHYNDADAYIGEREGASDYQVITNFILNPGYYDGCDESVRKGFDRYECLYAALEETNAVVADELAAMDVLSLVGRRSWLNDDGNGCTVHSAVYNLTDLSVTWVPNEHYRDSGAVYTYSLK